MHYNPRSYIVRLNNGTPIRRNREDLVATPKEDGTLTPSHETASPQTKQPEREVSDAGAQSVNLGQMFCVKPERNRVISGFRSSVRRRHRCGDSNLQKMSGRIRHRLCHQSPFDECAYAMKRI
ncbi:hypothetical protein PoB_003687700 [Plakobranchus ocellatus]|uniref:Uncharacterized protein n=1 Tax=Plakobranchus ocellatus TaxID=259542 RepID=A0AAV4AST4_9GAST|nr:hypothetical protein PoB_003687700 [Plakobranchus ocellatus]